MDGTEYNSFPHYDRFLVAFLFLWLRGLIYVHPCYASVYCLYVMPSRLSLGMAGHAEPAEAGGAGDESSIPEIR